MNFLKKPFPRVLSVFIGVIVGVFISSAVIAATGFSIFGGGSKNNMVTADSGNAELTALAYNVLEHIRDGDFLALSRTAHPESGVLFSPCATVSLSTNKRFNVGQIAAFGTDSNTYVWGTYYGSGEPIELTPAAYFSEFVFCRNYLDAPLIGLNRVVRKGNALENLTEIFPDAKFVDFHIPGGDMESAEDFNWRSLRLGFEEHDDRLRLIAIVHSIWTV